MRRNNPRRGATPPERGGTAPAIPDQGVSVFTPGQPPAPGPGLVPPSGAPRQFAFSVGTNIAARPRDTEATPFMVLRQIAQAYEGIQICERVYLDILGRLTPKLTPRPGGDAPATPPAAALALLDAPDGRLDLRAWLAAATRDLLELDAVAIYRRRRRDGRLAGLDLVDATTIKPLIDPLGRSPAPPYPAYQQFVWGMPGGLYRADELDYLREAPRTDSVYGCGRVERILFAVNVALRKQHVDLTRFTDGVVPAGFLVPAANADWTTEQLEEYEHTFNALLAGNTQLRHRVKLLPPGFTFENLRPDEPSMEYDRWLLNVTAACFGLTMAELGITEDVNKSSGETQENVVYRRAVRPLADFFARYLSRVVAEEIDPRYVVTWAGFDEPEDFATRAEALARLTQAGILAPERAATLLGLGA